MLQHVHAHSMKRATYGYRLNFGRGALPSNSCSASLHQSPSCPTSTRFLTSRIASLSSVSLRAFGTAILQTTNQDRWRFHISSTTSKQDFSNASLRAWQSSLGRIRLVSDCGSTSICNTSAVESGFWDSTSATRLLLPAWWRMSRLSSWITMAHLTSLGDGC